MNNLVSKSGYCAKDSFPELKNGKKIIFVSDGKTLYKFLPEDFCESLKSIKNKENDYSFSKYILGAIEKVMNTLAIFPILGAIELIKNNGDNLKLVNFTSS
jgi:hypothetical protein